jgi:hypothetical protein
MGAKQGYLEQDSKKYQKSAFFFTKKGLGIKGSKFHLANIENLDPRAQCKHGSQICEE